jgi:tetratricopeptide (TPR) repeat protein
LKYQSAGDASNLDKVRGYVEAFHHLCELPAWKGAIKILGNRIDSTFSDELHLQLAVWGYYREQIHLYNRLLGKAEPRMNLVFLIGLGNAYFSLSNYDMAFKYYQQSLTAARAIGERQEEGAALNLLGVTYCFMGNYPQAITYNQQALKVAQEVGDRKGEGSSLCNLGLAYYYLSDYLKALEYHQQELKIVQETGNRQGEARAFGNIGNIYCSFGEYSQAIEHYKKL